VTPYSTIESAGLFVLQAIVAATPVMFDDDIEVMMSRGEAPPLLPPPPFLPPVTQAGPVEMTAHPQMIVNR